MNKPLLNPARFFDANPAIRSVALELYESVKDLPIISPHGHTDPRWFAENKAFTDPASLLITPDHYVLRMLYSQGVSFEALGKPRLDGAPVEEDPRKIWNEFAQHYHIFSATPVGIWFEHIFHEVFGIHEHLNKSTATLFYDHINQALSHEDYLPRGIVDRFNIEVISTTDDVSDTLSYHQSVRNSDWSGRVVPTFRPDSVTKIERPEWAKHLKTLSKVVGYEIDSYVRYIQALEERRSAFKKMGATATDYDVLDPYTGRLSNSQAGAIFKRALYGVATEDDRQQFSGHMLMEMARMSTEDGLVMQVHPGSFRNHNGPVFQQFGGDMGADIPTRTEYTHNLHALLNAYGNDPRFKMIIFTLDESAYTRELAPLASHYPALKLGPAWWFNDSFEGMLRYRQLTTEIASIYNTVGFNDDTRALLSIPARHDLSRRVDSNYLAGLVATHRIEMNTAREMGKVLAYDLAKTAYNL